MVTPSPLSKDETRASSETRAGFAGDWDPGAVVGVDSAGTGVVAVADAWAGWLVLASEAVATAESWPRGPGRYRAATASWLM